MGGYGLFEKSNGRRETGGFFVTALKQNAFSLAGAASSLSVAFGYDPATGRFKTVTQGDASATYDYVPNSTLVQTTTFKRNTETWMTTTKVYDFINRLTSVTSSGSGLPSAIQMDYGYNNANQRTTATAGDGSRWSYNYDNLGQVTYGKKFWSDNTPVAGEQFEYNFDQIGNRTVSASGGDQNGANLSAWTYTPSLLNQIDSRTVPSKIAVLGNADATATVTVNGNAAVRKGQSWWREVDVANEYYPVWQAITNIAKASGANPLVAKSEGHIRVPQRNETFTYDWDGNLVSDSMWNYTWDAENRLVKMVSRGAAGVGWEKWIEFGYDWKGRRISKKVWNNVTREGTAAVDERFGMTGGI